MTIEQMKMILYVAETSSVNQAARRAFISQPALSKSIQAAERELGQPLFERSKSGMQPTEYGRIFCSTARSIVENYERVRLLSVKDVELTYPVLRVGSTPIRFAGTAFAEICRKHTPCALEMRYLSGSVSATVNRVANNVCDVGLIDIPTALRREIRTELSKSDISYTVLQSFAPLILISHDSPLAERSGNVIRPGELAGMTMFSVNEEYAIFERIDLEILRMLGLSTEQHTICYDPRAGISDRLRPNEFRCILDTAQIYRAMGERNRLLDNTRQFRLLPTPFMLEVGILRRIDSEPNALVDEYLEKLREIIAGGTDAIAQEDTEA